MGVTKIEWTDRTWNPVTGCTPVSEGCVNCYAARMAKRLAGRFGYPADDPFRVTVHPDRLDEPFHQRKCRIFVCSMGDLFHEDVPPGFVDDVFEVMAQCPWHTFLVLTKRPQNIHAKLYEQVGSSPRLLGGGDFLANVWFGVTAENQDAADERIPLLLRTPAAKRFVSCEPLLAKLDLRAWLGPTSAQGCLNWTICGGEAGPRARPMHPDWARSVRDQCQAASVPFFFKHNGEYIYRELNGEWLPDRVGKKRAGRLLDGREWNEMPEEKSEAAG